MSFEHFRRYSTTPATSPPTSIPPPAPPLPPHRAPSDEGRSSGLLDRFLGGRRAPPSRISQAQELRNRLLFAQNFGHVSSQSSSHRTGLKLRALDINETRTHVVLAGGKILKTVRVHQANCTEDVNIRGTAVNYAWKAEPASPEARRRAVATEVEDVAAVQRETFDIEDVAWSNGPHASRIATAAASGKVMLYDLDRPGMEVGHLHEHYRQVHKIDFNPLEGQYLLSASQDGTVRLWDLRTFRHVMKCESKDTFPGRSDGVRHTKWNPTSSGTFALATDNGTVQRWDIRQNRAPILRISAHTKTCNSIDWHPDGRHLISGGRDQDIKVWDLEGDRRQKPSYHVRAPKPIQNVRWRPPCYINDTPDHRIKQCTFFATSYRHYPVVHVWDLRRPYVPCREWHHTINTGTTDMLWHSQDLLWTVGPDGEFSQTDVRYAARTLDRLPLQALDQSPTGEVSVFFQSQHPSSLRSGTGSEGMSTPHAETPRNRQSELPSLGTSWGDDSLEDRFLSSSVPRRHSRAASFKSMRSLGSTPPSYEEIMQPVTKLHETMRRYDALVYQQQQESHSMQFHTALDDSFSAIASRHSLLFLKDSFDQDTLIETIEDAMQRNSALYQEAGRFTDAQSWKLLCLQFIIELRSTSSLQNIAQGKTPHHTEQILNEPNLMKHGKPPATLSPVQDDAVSNPFSNIPSSEHASPLSTPVARPIPNTDGIRAGDSTPDLDLADYTPWGISVTDSLEFSPAEQTAMTQNSRQGMPDRNVIRAGDFPSSLPNDAQQTSPPNGEIFDFDPDLSEQTNSAPLYASAGDSTQSTETSEEASLSPARPPGGTSVHSSQLTGSSSQDAPKWSRNSSSQNGNSFSNEIAEFDHRMHRVGTHQSSTSSFEGTHIFGPAESSPELSWKQPKMQLKDPGSAREVEEDPVTNVAPMDAATELVLPAKNSSRDSARSSRSPEELNANKIVAQSEHVHAPSALPVTNRSAEPLNRNHDSSGATSVASETAEEPVDETSALNDAHDWQMNLFPMALESLRQLVSHYSSQGEAQVATHLLQTTAPLLSCISQAMSYPTGASISKPKAKTYGLELLRLPHVMLANILSTYHDQLFALKLHTPATLLRRTTFPAFPSVSEHALQAIDVGIVCSRCRNPLIKNPGGQPKCAVCTAVELECSICWSATSPYDEVARKDGELHTVPYERSRDASRLRIFAEDDTSPAGGRDSTMSLPAPHSNLWAGCPRCAHAVHLDCAQAWFADPIGEGACPVADCRCDCAPGGLRREREAQQGPEVHGRGHRGSVNGEARKQRGSSTSGPDISRDEWEVGASPAARRASGALRDIRNNA